MVTQSSTDLVRFFILEPIRVKAPVGYRYSGGDPGVPRNGQTGSRPSGFPRSHGHRISPCSVASLPDYLKQEIRETFETSDKLTARKPSDFSFLYELVDAGLECQVRFIATTNL